MFKGNKILWLLVLICLGLNVYGFLVICDMQTEINQLKQSRSVTMDSDVFSEALKIIQGNNKPAKKKSLTDKVKTAAQAKALDITANKVKKSIQEKGEQSGKDVSTALKGVDMIFGLLQKSLEAGNNQNIETEDEVEASSE